jgi:hypothetical protein
MIETMKKNNFKENRSRVEQDLLHMSIPESTLSFEDLIEQKAIKKARLKIKDPTGKYSRAILDPTRSGLFTQELLKAKRVNGRVYFKNVCSIGNIEGMSYQDYQEIVQGNSSRSDASKIRGRFARASVQYEENLLSSVTSDDMREYLTEKLNKAILRDYHDLVWQSNY